MWLSLFRFSFFFVFTRQSTWSRQSAIAWNENVMKMCMCVLGVRQKRKCRNFLPHTTHFVVRIFEMWETHVLEHYIYHHNRSRKVNEKCTKCGRQRPKTLTSINLNLLFNFLATKVHIHIHTHAYTQSDADELISDLMKAQKRQKCALRQRQYIWYSLWFILQCDNYARSWYVCVW